MAKRSHLQRRRGLMGSGSKSYKPLVVLDQDRKSGGNPDPSSATPPQDDRKVQPQDDRKVQPQDDRKAPPQDDTNVILTLSGAKGKDLNVGGNADPSSPSAPLPGA